MTTEEQIKKMYAGQLASQKEQLTTDYEGALSELDAQRAAAQKKTDQNIKNARLDAQQAAMNNEEYYAASGLTSGAKAQARLAQETSAQENINTIRTAQQATDAEVERQRGLLSREYASAIRKAQADNDMALAQALYEQAEKAERELLAKQEAAANLMAQTGDYSRVGALYRLSDDEVQKLSGAAAGSTASGGGGSNTQNWDTGGYGDATVKALQNALGFTGSDVDGLWGPKSQAAAREKWGVTSVAEALAAYEQENGGAGNKVIWKDSYGEVTLNSAAAPVLEKLRTMQSSGVSQWDRKAMLYDAYKAGLLTKDEYLAMHARA